MDSAYQQFMEWLKKQPAWLQDATWRIFNGKKIDNVQIGKYADMCIAQMKGDKVEPKCIDESVFSTSDIRPVMSVKSISEIVGVNALSDEAGLEFAEKGVSVVYGLNGAGKSGYMRIFKQVSTNPYSETIQTNVFKKVDDVNPSCKFSIMIGDEEKTFKQDLKVKDSDSPMAQCDVFDTMISGAYIERSNNVSYEPYVFKVLTILAKVAEQIEAEIEVRDRELQVIQLNIPEKIASYEPAGWLGTISEKTVIPEAYTKWEEENESELSKKLLLLNEENVAQKRKSTETKQRYISSILKEIKAYQEANSVEEHKKLLEEYDDVKTAKERKEVAQKLFSDSASELDKISIQSADWQALWKKAKSYYEGIMYGQEKVAFATEGSRCPLCHQKICGETRIRVSGINEYINGTCESDYQTAESKLKTHFLSLTESNNAQHIKQLLVDIVSEEVLDKVLMIYESLMELHSSDINSENISKLMEIDFASVVQELTNLLSDVAEEMQLYEKAADKEGQKEIQERCTELQYQKWVYENMQSVATNIHVAEQKFFLINAKQLLKTNKITAEANKLAEVLITEAYIQRFTKELNALAPKLKVKIEKTQSQKGKSPYKVVLDTDNGNRKKPELILSEGEQRIVALAAFFADATGRNELSPIIIDDPISSLDCNYEERAIKRIVELAKVRQVILFTHRISVLVGLRECCKNNNVNLFENHIRSTSNGKGMPDIKDAYHGKIRTQLENLRLIVQATAKMEEDSYEYRASVSRISQQLRICVERSVEEVLLMRMVQRFDRRIMTNNKVTKLTQITDEDCNMIDTMMTKYSFTEHSQPADSATLEMDLEEVEGDIAGFITWIKEYEKKMN